MACKLYDRKAAAEYLGVSLRTLDRRLADGMIKYVSAGPRSRVHLRETDLDNYIKEHCRFRRGI